jgi:Holliday junction DNA helicase RuvA
MFVTFIFNRKQTLCFMYSHFEGKLVEKTPTSAIIDCNGVGYDLSISLFTFSKIKDEEKCKLFAHLVVREDAQILFGFATREERELFRHLISVKGVGANTARVILSSLSPDEITQAILSGNVPLIKSVKGIGAKTAQQIILDLKDKLKKGTDIPEILEPSYNTNKEEALSALTMLGFSRNVAEKAMAKVMKQLGTELPVEGLIKEALKLL